MLVNLKLGLLSKGPTNNKKMEDVNGGRSKFVILASDAVKSIGNHKSLVGAGCLFSLGLIMNKFPQFSSMVQNYLRLDQSLILDFLNIGSSGLFGAGVAGIVSDKKGWTAKNNFSTKHSSMNHSEGNEEQVINSNSNSEEESVYNEEESRSNIVNANTSNFVIENTGEDNEEHTTDMSVSSASKFDFENKESSIENEESSSNSVESVERDRDTAESTSTTENSNENLKKLEEEQEKQEEQEQISKEALEDKYNVVLASEYLKNELFNLRKAIISGANVSKSLGKLVAKITPCRVIRYSGIDLEQENHNENTDVGITEMTNVHGSLDAKRQNVTSDLVLPLANIHHLFTSKFKDFSFEDIAVALKIVSRQFFEVKSKLYTKSMKIVQKYEENYKKQNSGQDIDNTLDQAKIDIQELYIKYLQDIENVVMNLEQPDIFLHVPKSTIFGVKNILLYGTLATVLGIGAVLLGPTIVTSSLAFLGFGANIVNTTVNLVPNIVPNLTNVSSIGSSIGSNVTNVTNVANVANVANVGSCAINALTNGTASLGTFSEVGAGICHAANLTATATEVTAAAAGTTTGAIAVAGTTGAIAAVKKVLSRTNNVNQNQQNEGENIHRPNALNVPVPAVDNVPVGIAGKLKNLATSAFSLTGIPKIYGYFYGNNNEINEEDNDQLQEREEIPEHIQPEIEPEQLQQEYAQEQEQLQQEHIQEEHIQEEQLSAQKKMEIELQKLEDEEKKKGDDQYHKLEIKEQDKEYVKIQEEQAIEFNQEYEKELMKFRRDVNIYDEYDLALAEFLNVDVEEVRIKLVSSSSDFRKIKLRLLPNGLEEPEDTSHVRKDVIKIPENIEISRDVKNMVHKHNQALELYLHKISAINEILMIHQVYDKFEKECKELSKQHYTYCS